MNQIEERKIITEEIKNQIIAIFVRQDLKIGNIDLEFDSLGHLYQSVKIDVKGKYDESNKETEYFDSAILKKKISNELSLLNGCEKGLAKLDGALNILEGDFKTKFPDANLDLIKESLSDLQSAINNLNHLTDSIGETLNPS